MKTRKRFGEILLEAGVITDTVLQKALNLQKQSGLALGHILEDLGAISDIDIVAILARQFNLQSVNSIPLPESPETLFRLVDCELAIKKTIFPLSSRDGVLRLAISNPLDFDTLDKTAFSTGMRIEPVLATPCAIYKAIKAYYFFQSPTVKPVRKRLLLLFSHDPPKEDLIIRLELFGFLPVLARSLSEGFELACRNPPDLVLFGVSHDHQKDQADLQLLQFNPAISGKPVLAVGSRQDADEEAFLLELGFFDVVFRPLNIIRLLARIQRALQLHYEPMPRSRNQSDSLKS